MNDSASAPQENQAELSVEVRNEEGLHMRPAMQFVDCANGFSSAITVSKDDLIVDGKSIMQITMLTASKGTKLTIRAVGDDAVVAVETLADLIENKITDNID